MSRCFPFPPPGYENKAGLNGLSLIRKEKHKHKEKRHKDKDRVNGKHKEDKDFKKKHKDKKKEKRKSSVEKKTVGPLENQSGSEKPVSDGKPGDGANNQWILAEMGKRVRNDDMAKDSSCISLANEQNLGFDAEGPGHNRVGYFSEGKRSTVESDDCAGKVAYEKKKKNGDGLENDNRDESTKENKKRKKEEKVKLKEINSKERVEQNANDDNLQDFCAQKPKDNLKESWDRQGKVPKLNEPLSNGFLHDYGSRPDNMSRPAVSSHLVMQNGNGSLPSQKNTALSTIDKHNVLSNQKANGKVSSSQSLVKNARDMGPGPISDNFVAEPLWSHVGNHAVSNGFTSLDSLMEYGRKTAGPDAVLEKDNKKPNVNGILDGQKVISSSASAFNSSDETLQTRFDNNATSNAFASHSHLENGRKKARLDVQEKDNKDFRVNGILEGKKVILSQPPSASIKPPKDKAPHPDLKYLNQILTVPKVELPQYDDNDQEWLLGGKSAKKPKVGPSEIECGKEVWAEAMLLEHANVTVLPYVIPY